MYSWETNCDFTSGIFVYIVGKMARCRISFKSLFYIISLNKYYAVFLNHVENYRCNHIYMNNSYKQLFLECSSQNRHIGTRKILLTRFPLLWPHSHSVKKEVNVSGFKILKINYNRSNSTGQFQLLRKRFKYKIIG